MATPEDVLTFWFNDLDDQKTIGKSAKWWFNSTEEIDRQIKEKFEDDLKKAKHGEYDDWGQTAFGRLALVILFDQIPRNIYRNQPEMYKTDPLAVRLSLQSISEKIDQELPLICRLFLYMPLMHAEDLAMQKLSVRCFEALAAQSKEVCPQNTNYFMSNLLYSQRHLDIIKKFGRFPHRNTILKRESTPEEEAFLTNQRKSA